MKLFYSRKNIFLLRCYSCTENLLLFDYMSNDDDLAITMNAECNAARHDSIDNLLTFWLIIYRIHSMVC